MNEFASSLILAVIQGITEWLPVSSSGHLVLFQYILDHEGGLVFDVALHFGTLMAVFVYFGRDITDILEALLKGRFNTQEGKLGILILVSSIPAAIIGFLFQDLFEAAFKSLSIVALGFAITGIFMFISSIDFKERNSKNPTLKDSILIGCAQAVSIVPGISRSGSTLGTGLLLGLDRKTALKFSFLMSIPVIFGANILVIGNRKLSPDLLWATLVSFIVGIITIHLLLKIVLNSKKNLRWFGVYALLLALLLTLYLIIY